MRTVTLIVVALLAVGCSHATVREAEQTTRTSSQPPQISTATSVATPTTTRPTAPGDGAAINDVIGWIEGGQAADTAGYHTATRDGEVTELGDDLAFTAGAGEARIATCMTDSSRGGALTCLVNLTDPVPRPAEVYGDWRGNWVEFDGTTLQLGSARADPGPFHSGNGAELPDGSVLSFGDYRCRTDRTGLFCVNYAHRSAVRLGTAGVAGFGCLHPVPAAPDAGRVYGC